MIGTDLHQVPDLDPCEAMSPLAVHVGSNLLSWCVLELHPVNSCSHHSLGLLLAVELSQIITPSSVDSIPPFRMGQI